MRLPDAPPSMRDLLQDPTRVVEVLRSGIANEPQGRYLHWDALRRRQPPAGFTREEWWLAKKLARTNAATVLPELVQSSGSPFSFVLTEPVQRELHYIDRHASGAINAPTDLVANPATRDRYLVSSLIEEAITSSQLEGASTTHRVANDMLRSGRKPRTIDERMIANNFRGLEHMREDLGGPLSIARILELHGVLTAGTLRDSSQEGRFRTAADHVLVVDERDNTVLHTPPPAAEVSERMQALCDFANRSEEQAPFLHPAIKAILLHFMIGYIHPFVDGNGRTARALFYWSMIQSGYWLTEFLSISSILRRAPAKYTRAYLYTESDEGDTTYFIDYNLGVLHRAIDALHAYLTRKSAELRSIEDVLDAAHASHALNHRQVAVLGHALRNPGARYTVRSHRTSHKVSYETARSDLLGLASQGLLAMTKRGREMVFKADADIESRLKHLDH